jgi:hypothetical protein
VSTDNLPNLPPADELWIVRDSIKSLTERERTLRTLMLTDPSARTGNAYAVEIRDVKTSRTDLAELRKVHPDIVEQFTFPVTTQNVVLRGIDEDGQLVPVKRVRHEAV